MTTKARGSWLRDTLDGILQYAHLIMTDLTLQLLTNLTHCQEYLRQKYIETQNYELLENRLEVLFTQESLINGPLSIHNLDDSMVCRGLHSILRDINSKPKLETSPRIFQAIGTTLEEMLLKKRQISQEVVGALMRELAIWLTRPDAPKLYYLELIRLIFSVTIGNYLEI